ncbi:MAG: hypothetical protein NTX52_13750 [Planctomycetota bacterium]|nr:hypothetical protein [Planctomycetota bacterium]
MNLLIITNNPNRASFRQRIGVYIDALRSNGIDAEVAKLAFDLVETGTYDAPWVGIL